MQFANQENFPKKLFLFNICNYHYFSCLNAQYFINYLSLHSAYSPRLITIFLSKLIFEIIKFVFVRVY